MGFSISCGGFKKFARDGETYTCVLETENSNYLFASADTFIIKAKETHSIFERAEPPFDLTDEEKINQLFKDMRLVYNKHGREHILDLDLTFNRSDKNSSTILGVWYETVIERPEALQKRLRKRRPTPIKLVFTSPHQLSVQANVSSSHIGN